VGVHQVSTRRGGVRSHQSLTQETLKTPRISIYPILGEESMQVFLVEGGKTWMTSYKRYLADGVLPLEPTEARNIFPSTLSSKGSCSDTGSPTQSWYVQAETNACV